MNTSHPLLGKFDEDPGRWRPFWYGVEIDVRPEENSIGRGAVNLNNQPYILTRITHQIIGLYGDIESLNNQWTPYTITWKDEQSVYQNQPLPADCFMGNVRSGFSYEFPYPIPYSGNKTLTFEVYNRVQFAPALEDPYRVGIVLHGIADWGTVIPKR